MESKTLEDVWIQYYNKFQTQVIDVIKNDMEGEKKEWMPNIYNWVCRWPTNYLESIKIIRFIKDEWLVDDNSFYTALVHIMSETAEDGEGLEADEAEYFDSHMPLIGTTRKFCLVFRKLLQYLNKGIDD